MIYNSVVLISATVLILRLSELLNKRFGKKFFPDYYKRIQSADKRLNELKNLIRLTYIHNDKKTFQILQKDYAELYHKIFLVKIIVYSIIFIPVIIFAPIAYFFYTGKPLFLPAVNLIIFVIGLYFLIKFLVSTFNNFYIRRK